ncbi:MAG: hypothetical protein WDO16_23285 [Bacteroidota bacterium]
MACCGNKRNEYSRSLDIAQVPGSPAAVVTTQEDIPFEYIGNTGLTVTGNISGRKYRFSGNGDIQLINYRDAGGMMAVPVLRKLKGRGHLIF